MIKDIRVAVQQLGFRVFLYREKALPIALKNVFDYDAKKGKLAALYGKQGERMQTAFTETIHKDCS